MFDLTIFFLFFNSCSFSPISFSICSLLMKKFYFLKRIIESIVFEGALIRGGGKMAKSNSNFGSAQGAN